jgi:hypothetical protein
VERENIKITNLGAIEYMTDDDVELYLTLKFSSIAETMMAFRKAIGYPDGHIAVKINTDWTVRGIHLWTEQGCPEVMDIDPIDAEFFLKIKFGSVRAAYNCCK